MPDTHDQLEFFRRRTLRSENVPIALHPLMSLALFWGITDDSAREDLIRASSNEALTEFTNAVAPLADILEDWLCDAVVSQPTRPEEYYVFAALFAAFEYADFYRQRLTRSIGDASP